MRICYLPSDPDGPGSYRCLFPMEQLSKHGYDCRLPPHRFDHSSKKGIMEFQLQYSPLSPDADVYVFQMPQMDIYAKFAYLARIDGKIVIGETDDDYINMTPDHPGYYDSLSHPRYNRYWMRRIFTICDALTVSTPQLKRVYEEINPKVHVIPNALNWDMWKDVTPQYELDRERVRIGWMGSSKLRPRDIGILAEAVGPFIREHPEVDFVAAGDSEDILDKIGVPEAQRISYYGVPFRRRPEMTDLSGLPLITATMDIGLVPLVISDFNEAKSCLKGMEYAACGIPCIASPTEQYKEWVEPGTNGFLASSPAEWRAHLETLLNKETRTRMGQAARKKAKAHTIQRRWRKWAEAYLEVRNTRVPLIPGQVASWYSQGMSAGSSAKAAVA